jgi:uncharacterized SAM-binding protein YcdF (DUF218 family)
MQLIKKLGIGLGILVVVVTLAIIGIGFFLSPQDKLRHADLIVAISGGETSQRTNEAIRVYKEGYAPKLLFSGAAADPTGPSNAATMRRDAISQGVPASAILIEEHSTTTEENAIDSAPIIHQLGAHTIILVTSPYHQRRASLSFHQVLGPSVTIINHSASDSVWRKSTWWRNPYTIKLTLEELQKIIYVWSTKPPTASS